MQKIKFSGIGIHSGLPANVAVRRTNVPGIFFKRTDIKKSGKIPASWDNVSNTGLMSTTVGKAPELVQTIEHFMAALFISGIHNAVVEIDGLEFPIMDGGSKKFMDIFTKHKASTKDKIKKIIIKKEVIVTRQEVIRNLPLAKRIMLWIHGIRTGRKEDGFVKLSPDPRGLVLDVTLDYPDEQIGRQRFEFIFDGSDKARGIFKKEISSSRTFGRFWEWEYLKKHKMGFGAKGDNLIVLMDGKGDWARAEQEVLKDPELKKFLKYRGAKTLSPLHHADEFVRHKLIDAIGDLSLSGGFIIGKLESYKGSHAMNNMALRKLFSDKSNYDIIA